MNKDKIFNFLGKALDFIMEVVITVLEALEADDE